MLTLKYFKACSGISIVNLEQVNADWENIHVGLPLNLILYFQGNIPRIT